jgi:signal transduction histidine kinase
MNEAPLPSDKLTELVRKLGHDMRAPLGSIISTSEMLGDGFYDALTPKQLRANDRIQRNSQRVLAMLDDFVLYVKAQEGQLDLTPKEFEPRVCLTDWGKQVAPTAEKKGLSLHLTTQERVPNKFVGDFALIGRTVVPLIWNAVSFTAQGDVWVDSDWTDQTWVIKVRDTGPGIAAEHVPHIFEPFWRGEERPQVATAGAGLGLAVARALAKSLGARLMLEQTNNEGSIFSLALPISPAE